MAKKGNRVQVILECTEHKSSGKPGTSRYITTKNKKNTPDRMEIKKFNPILKRFEPVCNDAIDFFAMSNYFISLCTVIF